MRSAVADPSASSAGARFGTPPLPPPAPHHRTSSRLPLRRTVSLQPPSSSSPSPPSISISADRARPHPHPHPHPQPQPQQHLLPRSDSPLQHHLLEHPQPNRHRPPHIFHQQHHSGIASTPPATNMVTPEEYESLPPSIQKKYFSSVERLRIAQQSAVQKRKKQLPKLKEPWLSSKPSMDSIRPKTSHSYRASAFSQPKKSASLRRMEADVDEQQAIRFLSLPDKVKRSHFTLEELVLLTESSERALGCPSPLADDGFQRRNMMDRNGSVSSSRYRSSMSDELADDLEKEWCEPEVASIHSSEHAGLNDAELEQRLPQRQSSINSTFSALPQPLPRSESERLDTRRKSSFAKRRAFSLAPIPLPPPTLRPIIPPTPPSGAPDITPKPLPSVGTTPTENGAPTKYYKDSQARQKLREYLASPEKFDEALEFGFPTEAGAVKPMTLQSSTSDIPLPSDMEELSVGNSRGDEEEVFTASPKTPSTNNEAFGPGMTYHSSLDSGVSIPVNISKPSARSLSPDINGREMTLRMTLTRPDLRAPEQELYAFQRKEVSGVDIDNSDPLALSSLPVCDDHTGAHGAFAVSKPPAAGFKKVWKNIRGR